MRNRLFAVICVLLALAMLPGGASAKAKKAPKKDIGIQLYSVRSLIGVFGKSQGDYKPVLKQLADMGYTSVEAASYKDGMLYGQTPEQFRKDVEDAGMRVISTHCTLNLSDEEVCPICADRERDHATICVVEQVADVLSVENTRQYRGMYHVLGGVISPMQGISPSDLKIDLLCERIARGGVKEVILAISTSVEGETTLFYLMNRLRQFPGLKVTSIARGIGFGDELEYVDELTITHALMNRREIE